MIASVVGRRSILTLILAGVLLSFGILAWQSRGGAISYDSAAPAIKKLLEHYAPLLAIVAGFYFSERATPTEGSSTASETFILAVVFVGLWVLGPPVLITFSDSIDAAMRLLDSVGAIGTSLTSAAIAFYFSKSGKPGSPQ